MERSFFEIGLVGGIFDQSISVKEELKSAPENVLLDILTRNGHKVKAFPLKFKPTADVDLFHAHHFGLATYYLASTKRKRLVFTSHNPFIASRYPRKETYLTKKLRQLVFKKADAIIALSSKESEVFQEDFDVDPSKIRIIPNGLNIDLYTEWNGFKREDKSRIKLLFVGQLEEFKGIRYLLEALKLIKSKNDNFELTIVNYNQRLLNKFVEICRFLSLTENVIFKGLQPFKELLRLYHSCDIYIHPSEAESLPTTITEAMMCGKPVISTNVGGIPEQVTDRTGILVSPRDAKKLADAILLLIADENLRRDMGRYGRERASRLFNQQCMYEKHINLYKQILGREKIKADFKSFPYRLYLEYYLRRS